jgi:hypothetical protein
MMWMVAYWKWNSIGVDSVVMVAYWNRNSMGVDWMEVEEDLS